METRNVGTPSFSVPLVPSSVGLCLEAEEVITGKVRRYNVPGGSPAMSLHMTSDLAHPRRWGAAIPHTLNMESLRPRESLQLFPGGFRIRNRVYLVRTRFVVK